MRRPLLALLAALSITAALAPAAPASAATTPDKAPALAARLVTCTTGADEASRAAAFSGAMPALGGTKRMLMRFVLTQRVGPGPKGVFKRIALPGWGGWEKSDPGRRGFVFTKRVEALTAPAGYRAAISFRWLDAKGRTQRTRTRTTPVCEQPDPRPDLVLNGLSATVVNKTTAAYTVSVGNEGHGDAEPFAITLTIDGVTTDPITLDALTAGARTTGSLAAPPCEPGSKITITLDAADAVEESVEADDVVERPCPLA